MFMNSRKFNTVQSLPWLAVGWLTDMLMYVDYFKNHLVILLLCIGLRNVANISAVNGGYHSYLFMIGDNVRCDVVSLLAGMVLNLWRLKFGDS